MTRPTGEGFDVRLPASSRRYNAWLGGKDNFESDRTSANQIAQAFAPIRAAVSSPEGEATFYEGDLRQPQLILKAARDTLDFTRPIGLLLVAVLHFLPDTAEAVAAVGELIAALPSGSYLALTHATYDPLPDDQRAALDAFAKPDSAAGPFQPRTRKQVAAFLDGLHPTPPGLVSTIRWRPELQPPADPQLSDADAICYAASAAKP